MPAAAPDHGYFSSQATSSSIASTPIAVTTPYTSPSSPIDTPPSAYFTPSDFPHPPDMVARFTAQLPPPPLLALSPVRRTTSEPSPSPRVMTFHRGPASRLGDMPSPMDRPRRTPPPTQLPTMDVSSSSTKYTLHVQLPITIQPEMITISAQKGDKLKVVADAWHMENNCHYEWQISFPPHDINMGAVHAKVEPGGHLYIDVNKLTRQGSFHQ